MTLSQLWEVPVGKRVLPVGPLGSIGFFSGIRNQHLKETRCIAMTDPYCEWEFR